VLSTNPTFGVRPKQVAYDLIATLAKDSLLARPELPESVEASLAKGSWLFLENTKLACVGRMPVKAVRFDATKRKALDPSVLDKILSKA
jgi:hypothetical protein